MNKNEMYVGAFPVSAHTSKVRQNNGITLIALIITIIVMLILVAVTITMAINGGLFGNAGKAVGDTKNAINKEQQLANGVIQIGGKWYESIDDYIAGKEMEEWITIWEGEATTDEEGVVLLSTNRLFKNGSTYRITVESEEYTGTVETLAVVLEEENENGVYALFIVKDGEAIGWRSLADVEEIEANIDENTTIVLGYNITNEGSFMVFEGATYEYKVTKIEELKRKRIINVTQSEGQDLWSSTVTFTILPGDEDVLTLEQKKEIVAYMYDCPNYEDFKTFLENSIGKTYEEILEQLQMDEKTAINTFIEMGKNWMSFKDIEKLESLGIKVISVKTPYDTTLYTTSLGGEVACTFVKNGTYTFEIQSGGTKVEKSIEINNIRDYSTESPHDLRIEFCRDGGGPLLYSLDGSEEYSTLSSTDLNCNSNISLKFDEENLVGVPYVIYVSRDEQFYRYFDREEKWEFWASENGVFAYFMKETNLTCRQLLLIFASGDSTDLSRVESEWCDYMDDYVALKYGVGSTEYKSNDELLAAYPKASIGNKWYYNAENSLTINITKDTNMYIVSTWD